MAGVAAMRTPGSGVTGTTRTATQFISTFWMHPSRLASLPAADVAWMAGSLLLAVAATGAAVRLLRQAAATTAASRPNGSRLGYAFAPGMFAAALWVLGSRHDSHLSLRAGSLDVWLLAAMAASLAAVVRAGRSTSVRG